MKSKLILLVLSIIFTSFSIIKADDGYRLWLKYDLVTDTEYLRECRKAISGIDLSADSPTFVAARAELMAGLTGLTGIHIPEINRITRNGIVVAGTPLSCPFIAAPDFGGFLVKANSEGQPGPQNYGRTHADGANMLADALAPHRGVVMWRAFVYDNMMPEDRAKQAYNEFTPLDGSFRKNVLVQVKNGPIDFQPREPFHPLFGAMPETPLMMEFQITQEYLGCSTHLVFLAPLFEECLKSDTYCKGPGSYVAKVIDGSLGNSNLTGIAGVSNIGTERNWSGHLFGQANWFAFGRLAWNPYFASEDIAEEWVRMTFSGENDIVSLITVRWDFRMESGRTLWDELCFKYHEGVDGATLLLNEWDKLNGRIDPDQFDHVRSLLSIQVNEARWWRDACILYFQTFSKRPIPAGLEKPQNTLEYYMKLKFSYVPGI